ncbi:unnamed protein product, partial [Allacma fusca]
MSLEESPLTITFGFLRGPMHRFLLKATLEVVPFKWINKDQNLCSFPEVSGPGFSKLRSNAALSPLPGWPEYAVKPKHSSDSCIPAIKKATDLQCTSTVESSDSSTEENSGRRKRKLKPNARLQDFITETKGRKTLQTLPYANSLKPIFHEQTSSTNGLESDSESVASVYCAPESDKNNSRAATAVWQHLLKEIFPDRRSTGDLDAEPKVYSNIRGELR